MKLENLNIVLRYVIFALAFIVSGLIYSAYVGTLPTSVWIVMGIFIPTSALPFTYLSLNWKYIQSTRFGGRFGEINAPVKGVVSIPDSRIGDIDISAFQHYVVHINRWGVYTSNESPFTFFYDRFSKKWYYHYYNPKYEQIVETIKNARTRL